MSNNLGRRALLERAAAGLPLIGHGAVLWAQTEMPITANPLREGGPDALEHQTLLELARLYGEMRRHGPGGERARAFAARMRTIAVYQRAVGRSDDIGRRIAALVSECGRDTVIATPVDVDRVRRTLQTFGIDVASSGIERFLEPALTESLSATRGVTVDMLCAGGTATIWEHGAMVLERVSSSIDVHLATVRTVRVAQVDISWYEAVQAEICGCAYAGSLLLLLAAGDPGCEGSYTAAWLAAVYMAGVCLLSGAI